MYTVDVERMVEVAKKKVRYLALNPMGYLLLSAMAGIYLGFGICQCRGAVLGRRIGRAKAGHGRLVWHCPDLGDFCRLGVVYRKQYGLRHWNIGKSHHHEANGPDFSLLLCGKPSRISGRGVVDRASRSSRTGSAQRSVVEGGFSQNERAGLGTVYPWNSVQLAGVFSRVDGRPSTNDAAKIMLVFWCLFAFVGSGFEHSIANQSILGIALFLPHGPDITWLGLAWNQFWVVLGNVVGGGVFVGGAYWLSNPVRVQSSTQTSVSEALSNGATSHLGVPVTGEVMGKPLAVAAEWKA
jgi:nitrite transporter NirC